MNIERARYLASPSGRASLGGLAEDLETVEPNRLAQMLRKRFPPEVAAALGEQLVLRGRARRRFGELPVGLFTSEGLEMMTHPLVAKRRAARLAMLDRTVADLTCGLGGDLVAALGVGARAFGIERDRATALLAGANSGGHAAVGDALRPPGRLERLAIVIDPARRERSMRRFDPRAFSPPWDACLELLRRAAAGVLKGPPGLAREAVPPWGELEAVQLGRDLRELTVWAGEGTEPGLRRAVLLPGGWTLDSSTRAEDRLAAGVGSFVFDPESCVTRAGLVGQLAAVLNARQLDHGVAYLTGDRPSLHPLCATFAVAEVTEFGIGRLRELLRAQGWRPGEIRRRAFPIEPDELRRLLGISAGEPVTLLCSTIGGRRLVIIGRRVGPEDPEVG